MTASRRRGAPLVLLTTFLGGWICLRVLMWEPPFTEAMIEEVSPLTEADAATALLPTSTLAAVPAQLAQAHPDRFAARSPTASFKAPEHLGPGLPAIRQDQAASVVFVREGVADRVSGAGAIATAPPPFLPGLPSASRVSARWSADGWLLIRRDASIGLGAGIAPATYGASQAGAVLRYRLMPDDRHRPTAYLRASRSLGGYRQEDVAAGLSLRPLPDLPIVAAGELRMLHDRFGTRLRPVGMAITEFRPRDLGRKLRAEAYVQAGYAGGKGATAFADGQVRLDRQLLRSDAAAEIRVGAGAWGGAQRGASRLDVSPSVMLALPIGDRVFARASLDWRFRIAGHAAPASGPALTLSAGF